jgi:hypothetical protein
MATRTSTKQVTFRRPFLLSGFDSLQPAGTYRVDTEEELMEEISFPVWKRVATIMQLTRGGATEYPQIDPDELQEALLRDWAQPNPSAPPFASRNSRCEKTLAIMNAFRAHGKGP